ncbi:MAG TPA: hypothetical protein QGH10_12140 [Armatimonadota bacterium]|nr:hypothetical protein [Armatimonadota bacterium]
MTAAGMILASTAAGRSGKWAERFGAFILGFVAFKLLLEGL